MGKNVTFSLGPAVGLASRQLTITRHNRAGDDTLPLTATHDADAGSTATYVTVALADNTLWQAVLVDTNATGVESEPDILNFHTGSLQFPGPRSGDRLAVYSMEDLSSSSSSPSSPSSQSASSLSSQSNSSWSSTSNSSISISESSQSASSQSASSISISESSPSSSTSSSTSSSVSR